MNQNEYENWLYEIESKVSILNGVITATFENEYLIPLINCDTPKKALNEALAFSAKILSDEPGLPCNPLALHVLRLASKVNNLQINANSLYDDYNIRIGGEFELPNTFVSDSNSINMEFRGTQKFRGKKPNYLNLTLNPSNQNIIRELRIKKLHCFTSDMYELIDVQSIGIAMTNRYIIFCLPEKSKWSRFKGDAIDESVWHQQNWTRLAIGFTDTDNLKTAYSMLCAFLGNEFIKTPLWVKSLTQP